MRTFRFAAVALWAVVSLSGCACSGLGERTDCGDFAPVLDAYCGAIERCPDLYPLATRNRQDCVDTLCWAITCSLESDQVNGVRTFTIEQRTPVVDSTRVQGCVGYLNGATCDALAADMSSSSSSSTGTSEPRSACQGLLSFEDNGSSGGVGVGMSCENTSCQEGLFCAPQELDRDAGALTCQTCKKLPGIGEPCNTSGNCVAGLTCVYRSGQTECIVPLADGEACQSSSDCASKFCNPGPRTCDPGGKPGEPCAARTDCRQGFCNASGACENLHQNGEACAANEQCLNARCDPGTGICGLPDGATCQASNDSMCASGYCDNATLRCSARKPDGQSCQDATECQSNYCNYSSRTCTQHCNTDTDCAAGEYCDWDTNRCLTLRADGEACQDDQECLAGNCRQNDTCGLPPKIGEACTTGECYPAGYCSNGVCVKGKQPGEACEGIQECQAPYLCREKTCQAMNLACRPGKLNEGCAFLRVCDESTWCDSGAGFVCKAKKTQGSTCSQAEECGAGLTCVYGAEGGTCSPRGGEGATCTSGNDCLAGLNCVRSSTSTTSTCMAGPAGQPCDYDTPCPDGYFCNSSRDFCEAKKVAGVRCSGSTTSEECADGLYCDSTCKPLESLGAQCASYRPCRPELHCDSSTSQCVADAALGQSCSSSNECEPALYCNTSVSPATCAAKKGAGEMCTGDAQCLSATCYSGYGCLVGDACVMP